MVDWVFVVLTLLATQPFERIPRLDVSIERFEKYQWMFDGSDGFKVFLNVAGPIPDCMQVTAFTAMRGWDILRAEPFEDDPPHGEPLISHYRGHNSWTVNYYRWGHFPPATPPAEFKMELWFHRSRDETVSDGFEADDIDKFKLLESIRRYLKVDVSRFNYSVLDRYRHHCSRAIGRIEGSVGYSINRPFGFDVYFSDKVDREATVAALAAVERRFKLFKVTNIQYRPGYDK